MILAFSHVPKAAGTTTVSILRQSFGTRHCDLRTAKVDGGPYNGVAGQADLVRARRFYRRLQSLAGHSVRPYGDLFDGRDDIWCFTFLRDPWERYLSHFCHAVRRGAVSADFEKWLEIERFHNRQTVQIAGVPDAEAAIENLRRNVRFVGLVERFDESLVLLQAACPLPLDICYRRRNSGGSLGLKRELQAETKFRAAAMEVNREDMRLYRYATDVVFPRQMQRMGAGLATELAAFRQANRRRPVGRPKIAASVIRHFLYRPAVG